MTVLPQVQSAFAVVHWENTIVDEFEGLATLLKTWYPAEADDLDAVDIGDSSARRRRQAEITSPLPPGHYRPQLFRYSGTQIRAISILTQVQRDKQANLLD